jgi:hypothetical protein
VITPRFKPRLSASVPEGWLVRESIELMAPDERVSVLATGNLVSPETTLEQYAEQVAAELREHAPGYEELSLETVDLGGRPAMLRKLRWTPEGAEPVSELQMYLVADGRALAAIARSRGEMVEADLRALLAGIQLEQLPRTEAAIHRLETTARRQTYEAFEAGQLTTTAAQAFELDSQDGQAQQPSGWGDARADWLQEQEQR